MSYEEEQARWDAAVDPETVTAAVRARAAEEERFWRQTESKLAAAAQKDIRRQDAHLDRLAENWPGRLGRRETAQSGNPHSRYTSEWMAWELGLMNERGR